MIDRSVAAKAAVQPIVCARGVEEVEILSYKFRLLIQKINFAKKNDKPNDKTQPRT